MLGLRAREIHLCGGLEASHLVESLCKSTDDEFELIRYDRLSTLQIEEESLRGDYSKIQPGDCIVAFSIADIFSIRREIEKYTKHKCAVIYGQLPSETRSTQARLFNDDNSGYDVLVASDAIGMGLNLNIRRIVFHTSLKKFGSAVDGSYFIEPSHIKQIAGRAGRKSSNYPIGYVTTWQEIDLAYVKAVMKWDIPQIKSAGVFPSVDQIKVFYEQVKAVFAEMTPSLPLAGEKPALIQSNENENATTETAVTPKKAKEDSSKGKKGKTGAKGKDDEEDDQSDKYVMEAEFKRNPDFMRLSMIVDRFVQLSKVDSRYFMCDHASLVTSSNWLHTIPLSIEDRFTFANAPVNFGYPLAMKSLYCYAAMYAAKRPVPLDIRLSKSLPGDLEEFADLCTRHNIIDLYLWLSFRFPKYFIEREHCLRLKNHAIRQIEKTLSTQNLQNSYSFRDSYADLRRKMQRKGEQSTLPPLQFGEELRETTRRNIAAIPIADWYVVSENGEPSMISSHPQRRRSFEGQHKDKHGVTRKHGHKSGGDESGSNADSSVSISSIPEGVKKEEGTKIIDQSL